jgi:predicted DNA-binding ribbon-helix-helix protein
MSGADRHLRKRSFQLAGHRTSVALEPEFWAVLEAEARRRGSSLAAVVTEVDTDRATPLASALRVFALRECERGAAPLALPLPGATRPLDPA